MNQKTNEAGNLKKSPGQLAYERDLATQSTYGDGARRPGWNQLGDVAKDSWERNPTDRKLHQQQSNETEIAAEFARLNAVAPKWNSEQRRESVIDTFSMKWGIAKDEVAEMIDSHLKQKAGKVLLKGGQARTMDVGKSLFESALVLVGGTRNEWEPSKAAITPWDYCDVSFEGCMQTVRVGVSSGGVVSINGRPFTPDNDMKLNVELEPIVISLSWACDQVGAQPRSDTTKTSVEDAPIASDGKVLEDAGSPTLPKAITYAPNNVGCKTACGFCGEPFKPSISESVAFTADTGIPVCEDCQNGAVLAPPEAGKVPEWRLSNAEWDKLENAGYSAIQRLGSDLGVDLASNRDYDAKVRHLVAALQAYCVNYGVDLDAQLAEVRQQIVAGDLQSPRWGDIGRAPEGTQTGPDFSVSVDVEVTADSPEEAARFALDDLRDETLEAWSMDVKCIPTGVVTKVSVPGYGKDAVDQPNSASRPSPGM